MLTIYHKDILELVDFTSFGKAMIEVLSNSQRFWYTLQEIQDII